MKTTYINYLLSVSLFLVVILYWHFDKRYFDSNIDLLIENKNTCTLECAIFDYYQSFGEVPDNIQVLITYISQNDLYLMNVQALIDPLSRTPGFLNYIPFKNSQSGLLEAYILFSVGVDGELNFDISNQDNYSFSSITDVKLFYENSENLNDLKYDVWARVFGTKDLIVSKKNFGSNSDY